MLRITFECDLCKEGYTQEFVTGTVLPQFHPIFLEIDGLKAAFCSVECLNKWLQGIK